MSEVVCGKTYFTRRTMREFPQKKTCGLPPHEGNRHGQPKAVKLDAEPAGTCQACFRSQQTANGLLVLHGYRRPGHGYIIGNCYAMKYPPFEVSCERTKQFVAEVLKPALAGAEAALVRLSARPATIRYTGNVYVGYSHVDVMVELVRDEPEGHKPTQFKEERDVHYAGKLGYRRAGDVKMVYHPSYSDALRGLVHKTEQDIKRIRLDIADYEARIRDWKPVPWPAR